MVEPNFLRNFAVLGGDWSGYLMCSICDVKIDPDEFGDERLFSMYQAARHHWITSGHHVGKSKT